MSLRSDLRAALDPAVLFDDAFGMPVLDWQESFLRATGNVVTAKGRQVGASTAAAALAIHRARYAGDNAVIVSPSLKQSTEILGKARTGLRALGVRLEQDSASVLRLRDGGRIISLPGTARSVRGWTAGLLIIDEAAFVSPETWIAARALIATSGRLVVQSTPALEVGDFHDLVGGGEETDGIPSYTGWTRFTVRSDEVPTISAAFLDAERAAMSPEAFATEYECTFGSAGLAMFTSEQVDSMFVDELPPGVPVEVPA
jgi:hypothetical protein